MTSTALGAENTKKESCVFSISAYLWRIELEVSSCAGFFWLFSLCPLIDERELYTHACVKVVEKIAPVFKNGGLVVCLCKLIVDVLKHYIFRAFLFCYLTDSVRVHGKVRNGVPWAFSFPLACRITPANCFFSVRVSLCLFLAAFCCSFDNHWYLFF